MTHEQLVYKESALRNCFKDSLEYLNVDGNNDMHTIKQIKCYGALWHYTHQLLLAEEHESSVTTAETMDIKATGLKMIGGK
jgi:hypothetical protein